MKKRFLFAGVCGMAFVMMGLVGVGHAQEFRRGNSATVGSNETLDSSAYLAGKHVDVAGTIKGDLYCAGQDVSISGTIDGDVICAGQNVTISGQVNGNVRVAGQTVTISSKVKNNLTLAAQDFILDSAGSIGGDVTGAVSTMTINGQIGRDMVAGVQDATINGSIGRNIKSQVQNLSLGANAKVGGTIEYTSANMLNESTGAVVTGAVTRHQPAAHHEQRAYITGFRIYSFMAMLFTALILVLMLPSIFHDSAKRTFASPGKTLLLGIAATLFTPIVFVLLVVSLVGAPLGIILLLSWIVALLLSGSFFSFLIGRLVWKNQKNHVLTMLIGAVIVLLIYNIPIFGFFACIAAIFMGMGMVAREITHRVPKPNYTSK